MSVRTMGVVVLVCVALGLGGCNAEAQPRWSMPADASPSPTPAAKRSDVPTHVTCLAFIAKGNLVSALWVVHGSTQQTNSSGLIQVGSVAAEALRKAP